jgi:hypothetical protein
MAAKLYSNFPLNLGGGNVAGEQAMDLLSDTLKMTLRDAHTPTQTGDALLADLPADESSATGYSAGGYTLASKTYATSSLVTTFDCADPTWTITAGTLATDTGITYDDTIAIAGQEDPLIAYDDFGSQSVAGAVFTYTVNASGIFTITVS